MSNRQQLFPRGACLSRDRHACNFSWERSRGARQTSQPRLLVLLFLSSRCSHHTRPLLVTVIFNCDRSIVVRELTSPTLTLWVWHCVRLVNYHRRHELRLTCGDHGLEIRIAVCLSTRRWWVILWSFYWCICVHDTIYEGRFLTADMLCHSVPQLDTIIACIWSY